MKRLIQNIMLICMLAFFNTVNAQDRAVSGTIVDQEDNQPLSGVSVLVKGTSTGSTTDTDGRFTVNVPAGRNQLEISYAGYQKQTISIGNGNTVNLKLSKDLSELSEVQVVGYGVQKKSDLTGAISSIKGSEVTQLATQRVDQAIQGRAAGVLVLNTDGQPGGNTTIRVRGMNSINGGNNALIV